MSLKYKPDRFERLWLQKGRRVKAENPPRMENDPLEVEREPEEDEVPFPPVLFFFFFTLVTGPRCSLSLKLSDTRVYEPQIRANSAGKAVDLQGRGPEEAALERHPRQMGGARRTGGGFLLLFFFTLVTGPRRSLSL